MSDFFGGGCLFIKKAMNTDEAQLLRQYAQDRSEAAFTELVRRHLDLVWAAAWRVTRDAELARDVAQTVFADLARKARHLPPGTIVAGWLYRAACLAGAKAVRANVRRAERENQAMQVHSINAPDPDQERALHELVPVLDEALGQLGETDRNAVVLRFFAGKSLAELGAALGVSDDTAQKRLSRALEKLRKQFRRRGFAVSSGMLGAALGAAGSQAAPAGLAGTVVVFSLAAGSAAGGAGVLPVLMSIPTQFAAMKTQIAVTALVVVAVSTPLVVQQNSLNTLRAENQTLAVQAASLDELRERHALLLEARAAAEELEHLRRLQEQAAQLREEAARRQESDLAARIELQQQMRAAQMLLVQAQDEIAEIEQELKFEANQVRIINFMKQLGVAARLYANDNNGTYPLDLKAMEYELPPGIELNQFELVQHARPIGDRDEDLLVVREKKLRPTPDGRWERAYTLGNGAVQNLNFAEPGEFTEWEHQFIIHEP
jgi:RNA polymerase sigma factor (sigma-70 family)